MFQGLVGSPANRTAPPPVDADTDFEKLSN
jgi:hypothetical protein